MMLNDIYFASSEWSWLVICFAVFAGLAIAWSYWNANAGGWVRGIAAMLKLMGFGLLLLCLLEPMLRRPRLAPGENLFVLLADNSKSLDVQHERDAHSQGQQMRTQLAGQVPWMDRLAEQFKVKQYLFDSRLHSVSNFRHLDFRGNATALSHSLNEIQSRFQKRPLAGILLFTDGNTTDADFTDVRWDDLPPIYPVVLASQHPIQDLAIDRVSVSATNFEAAPVTLLAQLRAQGLSGQTVTVSLKDVEGAVIQSQRLRLADRSTEQSVRFRFRPTASKVSFFQIHANLESAAGQAEATLKNNSCWATVDRSGGPFRVLYVSGRPNWEFKFLRRAVDQDAEIDLVSLIRIAKREPKFQFLGKAGDSSNPLFRGFDQQDQRDAAQYDQPVLLRLDRNDQTELVDGFPSTEESLYRFHGVILDDVEADYFTYAQQALLKQFVSDRGGGVLMLGGQESFAEGGFRQTPIEELLPVYMTPSSSHREANQVRYQLTRDGWLTPWARLRQTETDEQRRLSTMPPFHTMNPLTQIKPGAEQLATVTDLDGESFPALVVQSFGKGRTAALTIGDWWRWDLRRRSDEKSDLQRAWRQTIRWLVADVSGRVEVDVRSSTGGSERASEIVVRVKDPTFAALDNGLVQVAVTDPQGNITSSTATASDTEAGVYRVETATRLPGAYHAQVTAKAMDGGLIGSREAGWVVQPALRELRHLSTNHDQLAWIAEKTGGEVVSLDRLPAFVDTLPHRQAPRMETATYPLWHTGLLFVVALICLAGEWGVRRWKGLP